MKLQLGDYLNLLLLLNVILTLILVSGWVSFILWKGVVKDVMVKLEEAIAVNKSIQQRTFEERMQ